VRYFRSTGGRNILSGRRKPASPESLAALRSAMPEPHLEALWSMYALLKIPHILIAKTWVM
jgi:hypothetical protein